MLAIGAIFSYDFSMIHHDHYIDAHCHLSDPRVGGQAFSQIERALSAGVRQMMMGGLHEEEWGAQSRLKGKYPDVIQTSYGIHPWWIEKFDLLELDRMMSVLRKEVIHADAIGETGLDFYSKRNPSRFQDQEYFFRQHIQLAEETNKPLVLHIVNAHERALALMNEEGSTVPAMVHSFSGSAEEARAWVTRGAIVSFSGSILMEPRRKKVIEALKAVPLDHLLFETDSPDQAWREGVNEPSLVSEVYAGAAELLQVSIAELKEKVIANFSKIR